MKIRHVITIVVLEEVSIPEGGTEHESDSSTIGELLMRHSRQIEKDFRDFTFEGEEEATVTIKSEWVEE